MTEPRNRRRQPDASSEIDDSQTDVQSPPNVLTPAVAGDAGSELDDAQTDVQPNETDTVPASEDETAESPPPAEATSDEAPAAEMDSDTTHEAPPPKADSGADDPPAAGSVPGALETFIAEDDDELPACPVCRLAIEPGADYVTANYGPVHAEPCSHQTRPGLV